MDQDETWHEVGLDPGHIVLHGDPPPPKGAQPLNFRPMSRGQTAGRIKMPLGREVGLGPGDIALDGDPPPSPKGGTAPNFWPMYCG